MINKISYKNNYKDRIINDALRTRGYYRWLVDTHFYEIVLQLQDESKLISEILQ